MWIVVLSFWHPHGRVPSHFPPAIFRRRGRERSAGRTRWLNERKTLTQNADMNGRLIATTLGFACVLGAGATIASHYVGRGAEQDRASEAAQAVPLFVLSGQQADPRPIWPPQPKPIAFNEEMIALLTMGATSAMAAADTHQLDDRLPRRLSRRELRRLQQEERRARQEERAFARGRRVPLRGDQAYAQDERPHSRRDNRADSDTVDIYVRDRRGRTVRIERVERDPDHERSRAYAPNPIRMFGPFGR